MNASSILILMPDTNEGLWAAITDRLNRTVNPLPFTVTPPRPINHGFRTPKSKYHSPPLLRHRRMTPADTTELCGPTRDSIRSHDTPGTDNGEPNKRTNEQCIDNCEDLCYPRRPLRPSPDQYTRTTCPSRTGEAQFDTARRSSLACIASGYSPPAILSIRITSSPATSTDAPTSGWPGSVCVAAGAYRRGWFVRRSSSP